MKLFLNCTQHNLTMTQREAAEKYTKNIDDIKNYSIFDEIKNSADNYYDIEIQINKLINFLKNNFKDTLIYLHLPIGSPVFMFVLSQKIIKLKNIIPLFSHTERKTIEKEIDGKVIKQNVFEFKKFIEIKKGVTNE